MFSQRSSVAALLPLAALIATANAHEHHGDSIPEGETISKDPIVRQRCFLDAKRSTQAC